MRKNLNSRIAYLCNWITINSSLCLRAVCLLAAVMGYYLSRAKLWHSGVPFQVRRRRRQLPQQGRTCCFDSSRRRRRRKKSFVRADRVKEEDKRARTLSREEEERESKYRIDDEMLTAEKEASCPVSNPPLRRLLSVSTRLKFSVTARRTPDIVNRNRSGCSFVDRLRSVSPVSSTITSA